MPRRDGVDAEEYAAIRLIPFVKYKLIEASAVAPPANLGRTAAVALIGKAAEVNTAGRGTEEIRKEVAGAHGTKFPKRKGRPAKGASGRSVEQ